MYLGHIFLPFEGAVFFFFRRRLCFLLIAAVLLPFGVTRAQDNGGTLPLPDRLHPALYIGGSAGATASFLFTVPSIVQVPHFGATAGATMHVENSKYTSLHASLLYTLRGWSESPVNSLDPAVNLAFHRYIHYLELPVLASIYYPFGKFRMGLEVGPQIGVMLGYTTTGDDPSLFEPLDAERYNYPMIGRFAWGIAGGPSFSLDFGRHRIALEARFYMGFNDIFSTTIRDRYSRAGELMATVTLSYLFRLL